MTDFLIDDVDDFDADDFDDAEDFDEEFGEGFDEGDADLFDDAEASVDRRRRRARARRGLATVRRRRGNRMVAAQRARPRAIASSRGVARPSAPAASRQLDLAHQVQNDAIQRAFATRDRRARRAEVATVASVVANQAQMTFSDFLKDQPYGRLAVSAAPLLLLSPQRRGTGASALLRDPRTIGFALAGALVYWEQRKAAETKEKPVHHIEIWNVDDVVAPNAEVEAELVAFDVDQKALTALTDVEWRAGNAKISDTGLPPHRRKLKFGASGTETTVTATATTADGRRMKASQNVKVV